MGSTSAIRNERRGPREGYAVGKKLENLQAWEKANHSENFAILCLPIESNDKNEELAPFTFISSIFHHLNN